MAASSEKHFKKTIISSDKKKIGVVVVWRRHFFTASCKLPCVAWLLQLSFFGGSAAGIATLAQDDDDVAMAVAAFAVAVAPLGGKSRIRKSDGLLLLYPTGQERIHLSLQRSLRWVL